MRYSSLGALCAVVLVFAVAVGGAVDSADYVRAEGLVTQIDRTCTFVATADKKQFEDECNVDGQFDALRDDPNRRKIVGRGEAVVMYASPVDGSQLVGRIKLDSRTDDFYSLRANDKIKIQIHKEDPTRIRKG